MMHSFNLALHGQADRNVGMMKALPAPYGQLNQTVHLRSDQLADAMKEPCGATQGRHAARRNHRHRGVTHALRGTT
jgi:hypothetical protein